MITKRDAKRITFGLIALWALSFVVICAFLGLPKGPGEAGDLFGAVNSLFSGLALLAVVYSILLQREDLLMTKEEIRQQHFDNVFFSLLRLHQDIVDKTEAPEEIMETHIEPPPGEPQRRGRSAFKILADRFVQSCRTKTLWSPADSPEAAIEAIDEAYKDFHDSFGHLLGHYFRNLYHLVRKVHEAPMPRHRAEREPGGSPGEARGFEGEDKWFYIRVIRAQLSEPELVLLLYNCLSRYGAEKFRPLVDDYHLMDELLPSRCVFPEDLDLVSFKAGG